MEPAVDSGNPAFWGAIVAFVTAGITYVTALVTTRQRLKDHIIECENFRRLANERMDRMQNSMDRIQNSIESGFREVRADIKDRRRS